MTADESFDAERRKAILGESLRELRRRANITQAELAARAGTDETYISHLEHGRIDIKWSTLGRVLDALGATVNQLAAQITKRSPR